MRTIYAENVNQAYAYGVRYLKSEGVLRISRAGPVREIDHPVMTVYIRPCERVLLYPERDANPFFHLFEALWMLAGREDAAFLNRFVGDFGERYAEEDGTIHDAYGYRWRNFFGVDQIEFCAQKLRKNPMDRQCVIQMWSASEGVEGAYSDLTVLDLRTRPCNTHIYLRAHENRTLDMTVMCRSNDMIYGGYGANAVHFSVLLEYIAARAGLTVGKMYQLSNNYHAYVSVIDRLEVPHMMPPSLYPGAVALIDDPLTFDDEVALIIKMIEDGDTEHALLPKLVWRNSFLRDTAAPMAHAHTQHKMGRTAYALDLADKTIAAPDWRAACLGWLGRRATRAA
jgi:thymidylate synthase